MSGMWDNFPSLCSTALCSTLKGAGEPVNRWVDTRVWREKRLQQHIRFRTRLTVSTKRSDLDPLQRLLRLTRLWMEAEECLYGAEWQPSERQHDQWSTCFPLMAGVSVTDMDGRLSVHFLWFLVRDPTVWAFGTSWFLTGACPALLGMGRSWL